MHTATLTEQTVGQLKRVTDYSALDENSRAVVRRAADLIEGFAAKEQAAFSSFEALLSLLSDPQKYKKLRDDLGADIQQLKTATAPHDKASAQDRQTAARALADAQRKQAEAETQIAAVAKETMRLEQQARQLDRRAASLDGQEKRLVEMKKNADETLAKIAALRAAVAGVELQ